LRVFSIVGVLADANGFGKPDNNILPEASKRDGEIRETML
jgi:hypothetical protein